MTFTARVAATPRHKPVPTEGNGTQKHRTNALYSATKPPYAVAKLLASCMPVGKANQTQSQLAPLKIHSVHIGNVIQSQNVYQRGSACYRSSRNNSWKPPEANQHVHTTYSFQKWRDFLWSGQTLVGFELASHLARFYQLARANEHVHTSSGNNIWPCQLAHSGIVWTHPNTVHSCSRQGVVTARLTSERPRSVIPFPKTLFFFLDCLALKKNKFITFLRNVANRSSNDTVAQQNTRILICTAVRTQHKTRILIRTAVRTQHKTRILIRTAVRTSSFARFVRIDSPVTSLPHQLVSSCQQSGDQTTRVSIDWLIQQTGGNPD
jgi:hypothetical protein